MINIVRSLKPKVHQTQELSPSNHGLAHQRTHTVLNFRGRNQCSASLNSAFTGHSQCRRATPMGDIHQIPAITYSFNAIGANPSFIFHERRWNKSATPAQAIPNSHHHQKHQDRRWLKNLQGTNSRGRRDWAGPPLRIPNQTRTKEKRAIAQKSPTESRPKRKHQSDHGFGVNPNRVLPKEQRCGSTIDEISRMPRTQSRGPDEECKPSRRGLALLPGPAYFSDPPVQNGWSVRLGHGCLASWPYDVMSAQVNRWSLLYGLAHVDVIAGPGRYGLASMNHLVTLKVSLDGDVAIVLAGLIYLTGVSILLRSLATRADVREARLEVWICSGWSTRRDGLSS
ncbi:hypothetical protein Nepgr_021654 [Nepenthes gracilis]|uniref:Uncharacterized protein n=1 Tax=Nepenthes gracilis TaxID=150966 RepID=A0AAD3XW92_NEPGR|nr:hypothetical protein Nepgr_021654 [Nepenthes gracilis]